MKKYRKLSINYLSYYFLSGALVIVEIISLPMLWTTRPRSYKTFFMLNSAEHEILNVHKYIENLCIVQAQISLECHFFPAPNVKMLNCWHFEIYEQGKFHAQLN